MHYDVFNGDADGICGLLQLRLAQSLDSILITGVKRDIALVQQVDLQQAESVSVLDISLDKNRQALIQLLEHNIGVEYFDHHFPGDIPIHAKLDPHIDTDKNTCTALIVNQYLGGKYFAWAVVAAFGDNLAESAIQLARIHGLDDQRCARYKELGELINYNAYGDSVADLCFAPDDLYHRLYAGNTPDNFIATEDFYTLREQFQQDLANLDTVRLEQCGKHAEITVLPNEPWARRMNGHYSNRRIGAQPDKIHAIVTPKKSGGYSASLRTPANSKIEAQEICRQFPGGGGRSTAAGINYLDDEMLEKFLQLIRSTQ